MSGWDATSRPGWDPQSGSGESTQAFGVPELAEDGGFPSSAAPGTPPAIFLQDYDKNDFAQADFAQGGFGQIDFGQGGFDQGGFDQGGFEQAGFGHGGFEQGGFEQGGLEPNSLGQGEFRHADFGQSGQGDFGQTASGQADFGQGDFGPGGQGDFRQHSRASHPYNGDEDPGRRGYSQRGPASGDYPRHDAPRRDQRDDFQWDGADRDHAARDVAGTDRGGRPGYPEPFGYSDRAGRREGADSDFAARMDPALRDFFSSQPGRQDALPQGNGQPRHGARGYQGQSAGQGAGHGAGHGAGPEASQRPDASQRLAQGRGGQFGPALPNGRRPPGAPGQAGHGQGQGGQGGAHSGPSGRWDFDGPQRPAARSGHRQDSHAERRGLAPAAIAIGLVVVIGIAIGAYMLMHRKPASTASTQSSPTATPTATATKSTTKTEVKSGAGAAGFTLKTPATAGGYAKLTLVPTAVQSAAATSSAAIKSAAVTTGAKVTSQVTAGYQLSAGQVLAFTGFQGTFNPAKVMTALAALGTDSHSQQTGAHGGMLACATTPSAAGTPGTVCVWVTPTTMGIAEFFASNDVPEVVTLQSKAAEDTVKLRGGVEVSKAGR